MRGSLSQKNAREFLKCQCNPKVLNPQWGLMDEKIELLKPLPLFKGKTFQFSDAEKVYKSAQNKNVLRE